MQSLKNLLYLAQDGEGLVFGRDSVHKTGIDLFDPFIFVELDDGVLIHFYYFYYYTKNYQISNLSLILFPKSHCLLII